MKNFYMPNFRINAGKTVVLLALATVFVFLLCYPVTASEALAGRAPSQSSQDGLLEAVNETTRTALSPLLAMVIKLAIEQANSETVNPLLIILIIFLTLVLLKDVLPVNFIKKPLDAAEELTASFPALLGLVLILPGLMEALSPSVAESVQAMLDSAGPTQVYAASDYGGYDHTPPMHVASDSESSASATAVSTLASMLGQAIVALTGAIIYCAVWLLSNTLTILCLIVPAPLGPVVKSVRLILLGFLHTLSVYSPLCALFFSVIIIVVAFLVSRWAFKLLVWGGIYSFDLLTFSWRRHKPTSEPMAFVTGYGRKVLNVPKRTLGRLSMENGCLIFRYRLFLLFPKAIELPLSNQMVIGRRMTSPLVLQRDEKRLIPLLAFRLSCRTHEELLAQHFGGLEIQEIGLKKWLKGAWAWMDRGVSHLKTYA